MNRNEKIDNQLAEIGLMSSRHAELIRHRRFKIVGEIMMLLVVGCGTALMILGIINQQIALAFAGMTIAILATMQGCTFTNEKFGLDSEIDDKIAVTMAEITKDINEMTQKFIEELKNNREKAEQDALKCSLKGKNTKNNAQKAKNKTKSVAKTTKKEK